VLRAAVDERSRIGSSPTAASPCGSDASIALRLTRGRRRSPRPIVQAAALGRQLHPARSVNASGAVVVAKELHARVLQSVLGCMRSRRVVQRLATHLGAVAGQQRMQRLGAIEGRSRTRGIRAGEGRWLSSRNSCWSPSRNASTPALRSGDRDAVNPGRTTVGPHLLPRPVKDIPAMDAIPQRIEASLPRPLGRQVQLDLEFSDFVFLVVLDFSAMHRSFHRRKPRMKQGPFLTRGCVVLELQAVLRTPRHPAGRTRLRRRLIGAHRFPGERPQARGQRGLPRFPHRPFRRCRSLYPGEFLAAALQDLHGIRGLRPEFPGSASSIEVKAQAGARTGAYALSFEQYRVRVHEVVRDIQSRGHSPHIYELGSFNGSLGGPRRLVVRPGLA
jgi:hypothetical protein